MSEMRELTRPQEAESIKRLDEPIFRVSNAAIADGLRSTSVLDRLLTFVAAEYTEQIGASATAGIFCTCAETIDASDFGQVGKAKLFNN